MIRSILPSKTRHLLIYNKALVNCFSNVEFMISSMDAASKPKC